MVPITPHHPWYRSLVRELPERKQEEIAPDVDGSKGPLSACKHGVLC